MPELAGKWRAIVTLAVAELLALSLWFSASATLPAIRAETDLSDFQAALFTSMLSVGFVAGTLTSAVLGLADRIRPQTFFFWSIMVAAAANAAILVVDPASPIVPVLRFVTGACMAGVYPVGMKMVSSWARGDTGLLVGLLVGALTFGSGMPHLVQAYATGIDWRLTIIATSAAAVIAGFMALTVVLGPGFGKSAPFRADAVLQAWRNKALRLANFGYFGHMWELYAMWGWIGVFFHASFAVSWGADDPDVGKYAELAAFAVLAVGAVGAFGAGVLADRLGRTTITIWAMLLSGTSAVLVGFLFGGDPVWLVLLCLFWGVVVIADSAQFSSAVIELADPERVGTMLTVQTSVGFALTLISIHLLPEVVGWIGWEYAFSILAIGPALGVWSMWRLRQHPDAARLANGRR